MEVAVGIGEVVDLQPLDLLVDAARGSSAGSGTATSVRSAAARPP